jgi:hypothetical protein
MTAKQEMIENLKTIRRACVKLSAETDYEFGEIVGRINEEVRLLENSPVEHESAVKSAQRRMISEKESMSEEKREIVDDEIEELGGLKEVEV